MPYVPEYDFSSFQSSNPTTPLPGGALDTELASIAAETVTLADKIDDVRRSDGALKNEIVTLDSLDPEVLAAVQAAETDAENAAVAAADSAAAAAASALTAASLSGGIGDDVLAVTAAKEAAEAAQGAAQTAETNAEAAATAAAVSAGVAETHKDAAAVSAATATTKADEASTSAGVSLGSASVAVEAAAEAGANGGVAESSALSAEEHADAAAASAAAAAASAAAADAVLDELLGASLPLSPYFIAVNHGTADLTITSANKLTHAGKYNEWTIADGNDSDIIIEADVWIDAEHPEYRLEIPLRRLGNGAGKLKVAFEADEPVSGTAAVLGTPPTPYEANDTDGTANTTGPLFDGAMPLYEFTAPAGDDRVAVCWFAISLNSASVAQSQSPAQSRTTAFELDTVSKTPTISFPNEAAGSDKTSIACAVIPLGSSPDPTDHDLEAFTNSIGRENQVIAVSFYEDIDQTNPVVGTGSHAGNSGTLNGSNYEVVVAVNPGSVTGCIAECMMAFGHGTTSGLTASGGSEVIAINNAGQATNYGIAWTVRRATGLSGTTTFKLIRPSSNNVAAGQAVILRPVSTPGGPKGDLLPDDNVAAELTRPNQAAVLVLSPSDGVSRPVAWLHGV